MKRSIWVVALCVLFFASGANAGGFNIYEMGARATALGGAFTATADDGSAVFYNPAGLAWQADGWAFSGNLALIKPTAKYTRAAGLETAFPGDAAGQTKGAIFTPVGMYVTYNKPDSDLGFAFGFYTPFGLGIEWDDPDAFAGRALATNSQIQGLYFSPMVTWQANEQFALSAGFHAVKTHLTLERTPTTPLGANVGDFKMEGGSNWSLAPAFGAMFRPNEKLSLGLNFKGGVTNTFEDQDAELTFRSGAPAIETTVTGDLDYPSIMALGIRYDLTPKLGVMFDYVWVGWSVFDVVELDFESGLPDATLVEEYEDVAQFRFGAEYQAKEDLRLMAGFVYDESPQPTHSVSPLLPDANRLDYSFGLTYSRGALEYTFAYMLVDFEERSTIEGGVGQNPDGLDGNYHSVAHIPTFGVSKTF